MTRRLTCATITALLIFAASAEPIHAQNSYALGVGGGAAIPVGRLKDAQTSGFNGLVSLVLGTAELPVGVRIDGIYSHLPRNGSNAALSGSSSTGSLRVTGALGNLIFALPGTTTKAYVIAGGGLYYTKRDLAGAKPERNPGLNGGAGFTFALGPFASFVEARYHFVRRQPSEGGLIHFVPITLGVMF